MDLLHDIKPTRFLKGFALEVCNQIVGEAVAVLSEKKGGELKVCSFIYTYLNRSNVWQAWIPPDLFML